MILWAPSAPIPPSGISALDFPPPPSIFSFPGTETFPWGDSRWENASRGLFWFQVGLLVWGLFLFGVVISTRWESGNLGSQVDPGLGLHSLRVYPGIPSLRETLGWCPAQDPLELISSLIFHLVNPVFLRFSPHFSLPQPNIPTPLRLPVNAITPSLIFPGNHPISRSLFPGNHPISRSLFPGNHPISRSLFPGNHPISRSLFPLARPWEPGVDVAAEVAPHSSELGEGASVFLHNSICTPGLSWNPKLAEFPSLELLGASWDSGRCHFPTGMGLEIPFPPNPFHDFTVKILPPSPFLGGFGPILILGLGNSVGIRWLFGE
ncbi:uncharacterized protein LOC126648362 isoform X2 [Myiozetetes cayanensis]|uniref:uncharacterized protein LOC126648362 isoform X2 n=1 Tax=Myiozetetes cayanensis TaxID=478635 RepID=UPI00215E0260|nr:uncharacterized protein LOC126648362 isoform X2 [Myiozetetes cayanensis]